MAQDKDDEFEGQWLTDSKTGCRVWLRHGGENKRVRWSGACVNDVAEGGGTLMIHYELEDGQHTDCYDGELEAGRTHGRGAYVWSNRDRYEGDFEAGRIEGRGVYVWANGQRYEGDLKDGRPHGRGVMIGANGERREGEWIEGRSAKSTPLDPAPAWELARAARIVAAELFDLFEADRGKLSAAEIHGLHDRLLRLSLALAKEAWDVPELEGGALDGSKIDRTKVKATWILSGVMEELENRVLPPRKG